MDEFLFCQEMKERTRAKDVFHLVNAFLRENSIAWDKVGSVCTDGAPAMVGHRSGFVALMKQVALHIVSNHYAILKYTLACKTFPLELKGVLDSVVRNVNFILGRPCIPDQSKHFETTLERSISTFFFTPKRDSYRGKSALPCLRTCH